MKLTVYIALIGFLGVAGLMTWLWRKECRHSGSLAAQVVELDRSIKAARAAAETQSQTVKLLQEKLDQVTEALTNSTARLREAETALNIHDKGSKSCWPRHSQHRQLPASFLSQFARGWPRAMGRHSPSLSS